MEIGKGVTLGNGIGYIICVDSYKEKHQFLWIQDPLDMLVWDEEEHFNVDKINYDNKMIKELIKIDHVSCLSEKDFNDLEKFIQDSNVASGLRNYMQENNIEMYRFK